MTQNQVTWSKLKSGEWGLRLPHDNAHPGDVVTVHRKDGTTSSEKLGTRVAGGPGWSLWAVAPKDAAAPAPERKAAPVKPKVRKGWQACGYPGCSPDHCDECEGEGRVYGGGF